MLHLKQSTTITLNMGPFLDKTDGVTEEIALTLDVEVSKNGGTFANRNSATAITHDVTGWYKVELDATDTGTLGRLIVKAHDAANALPVWVELMVMPANVWDSMYGSDKLDVNVEEWNATAVPAEHTAGYPVVTVKDGTGTGEINTNAGAVALVDAVTTVNGLAAGVVTATAIAADAITAAKIADGAIDAATFAPSAIDSTALAANAINSTKLANGTITSAKFSAGAIDAAAIAAGAIDADALAADAVTEIRSIVSGTADSGSTTTMVDAARTEADTDYWAGAWILFTSGTISGQVRLITGFNAATDTITFAPATTQAVGTNTYEILPAGAVDLRLWNGSAPSNLISGRVDANAAVVGDKTGFELTAADKNDIVDRLWDEPMTGHLAGGSTGFYLGDPSAQIDPWSVPLPAAYGAGTAGKIVGDNVNATISSRASAASLTTAQTGLDDIQTRLPASLVVGRMDSSVGVMQSNTITAGAIASNAITAAKIATDAIGAAQLAADAVTEMQSGLATSASVATLQADTDNIQTRLPAALVSGRMDSSAAVVLDKTGYSLTSGDKDAIVDATWDEAIAGHLGAGSTGAALDAAGTGGDPWTTPLPGAYGAGTAGKILGDNLNATMSSRATPAQVNAEVLDVMTVDTFTEEGQGVPPATSTFKQRIAYLFKFLRNRITQDGTTFKVYADNATTVDQKAAVSDNGTVFDRGEVASGP